jgi:hypothetical protein
MHRSRRGVIFVSGKSTLARPRLQDENSNSKFKVSVYRHEGKEGENPE